MNTRSVLVLGSTGSVGTQALDLIAGHPDRFTVAGLAAGGRDLALLGRQIREHGVRRVAVTDPAAAATLRRSLPGMGLRGVEVWSGPDAATELTAASGADVVLNAITGSVGLGPTLAALRSGRDAGAGQQGVAGRRRCAGHRGGRAGADRAGRLGALGAGPVPARRPGRGGGPAGADRVRRDRSAAGAATSWPTSRSRHALAHPTWDMGPMVTINSATLINKGLELIEAHLLFDVPYERIDVVVHPQSIVHSMVTFVDGSTLAQASPPDMTLPIALALAWPERVPGAAAAVPLGHRAELDLRAARRRRVPRGPAGPGRRDGGRVPARRAERGQRGGGRPRSWPARCRSPASPSSLERVLDAADGWTADPTTVADVLAAEEWARDRARGSAQRSGVIRR